MTTDIDDLKGVVGKLTLVLGLKCKRTTEPFKVRWTCTFTDSVSEIQNAIQHGCAVVSLA